jgi:hypothetical protein
MSKLLSPLLLLLLLLHNQYPNLSSSIAIVRPREREIAKFTRVNHLRATWVVEMGGGHTDEILIDPSSSQPVRRTQSG